MAGSYTFRNITTYVVEPDGEPIESLPTKSSLDFSPQTSCLDEAPDDGKQYGRQSKGWTEVNNDHAELDNLDYENSGHTGFAASGDIPTKVSDLENDTGFITSSSLTKENITDLKLADSPEFNNSLLTQLQQTTDGGGMSTSLWTWIVGLFPSIVKKSVFSHINSIWDYLWKRDGYLLKYVVPADTYKISLTTDKFGNNFNFVDGDVFKIIVKCTSFTFVSADTGRISLRMNAVESAVYNNNVTLGAAQIDPSGSSTLDQYTEFFIHVVGTEIQGTLSYSGRTSDTVLAQQIRHYYTTGLNASAITSIELIRNSLLSYISAGTEIIIVKMK